MFISPAPSLHPRAFLRSGRSAEWFDAMSAERTQLFSRGCDAVAALLGALNLSAGQGVLVPSYLCGEVIDVFAVARVPVTLYAVDAHGRLDPDEIAAKITPEIRAIYVVHYFGFPQEMHRLRQLADAAGIVLIEDCAHALFGRFSGRWLGEFGDAAVFSLRKTLPLPDGGALLLKDRRLLAPATAARIPAASTATRTARLLAKALLLQLRWRPGQQSTVNVSPTPSVGRSGTTPAVRAMSGTAEWLYRRADVEQITARRRANFAAYLERLREVALYQELPPGVVPFSFPILVDRRDEIAVRLAGMGLPLNMGFPEAPVMTNMAQVRDTDLSGARFLASRVLELPVHQDIDSRDLETVIELYTEVH